MTQRPIRAADLFCGSGGLSTALVLAVEALFPGRELDLVAVNHWQVAIDTHQANHPGVRHFCADLEHLKPRDAVPGGVLDILLAAPSCTYHSRARGGRPVYDQQRMDPWHVVRWCTDLRVHRLLVENVPEFVDWGPCHAVTGKPIKARKGEYFRAWIQALKAIGMRADWKVITCADYGDATTRERFFLTGRSDKRALRWPESTHAPRGAESDLLGTRKTWRSAAEIIDWSRPGTSIFTRKRPLVKNTLTRLLAGAKRNHWPQQHIAALQAMIDGKQPQLHVTAEDAAAIAAQLGIPLVMATGGGGTARGVDRPLPGITTGGNHGVTPHFAEPIILHKANSDGGRSARGVVEPMPTVTTNGAGALVRPIITPYYGTGSGRTGQSVDEPVPAQGTKDRFAIATPTLIRAGHGDDRHTAEGRVLDEHEPIPAVTGSNEIGIATPTIFRVNQGDGRQRGITSSDDPLPTLTGSESLGVATPFLVPNWGERDGQEPRTHSIGDPAPTICGTNTIHLAQAVIAPCTHHDSSNRARGVDQPLPTITGANRGDLAIARPFVSLCTHGNEANATRAVEEPIPTVTTAKGGELTLATPAIADGYYIDILYRMLHWTELARATSFEDEGRSYHFTGTSTEITKQIGNAVPIRTGAALCREALAA